MYNPMNGERGPSHLGEWSWLYIGKPIFIRSHFKIFFWNVLFCFSLYLSIVQAVCVCIVYISVYIWTHSKPVTIITVTKWNHNCSRGNIIFMRRIEFFSRVMATLMLTLNITHITTNSIRLKIIILFPSICPFAIQITER